MNPQQIIQNYMEKLWNHKNLNAINEIFTPETVIYSPMKTTYGKDEMRHIAERWLHAFPDLQCQWKDWIVEDNKVVSEWTAIGTHLGNFQDFLPTGKIIKYSGISIYKLSNNKIVEYRGFVDMHSIISQMVST